MSARDAILARIIQAKGHGPVADECADHPRRDPRGPVPRLDGDLVQRFCDQAVRLASDVARVATAAEVAVQVAAYLRERELPMEAICWPALAHLDWRGAGLAVEARPARGDDSVGITAAFAALAETGTLMLLSGPETPATVSLLPETHVAVVEATRIVATMEDGWDRLRATYTTVPRGVSFISGPSRTADIEQTVTLGAHGPARVFIVVVDAAPLSPP